MKLLPFASLLLALLFACAAPAADSSSAAGLEGAAAADPVLPEVVARYYVIADT